LQIIILFYKNRLTKQLPAGHGLGVDHFLCDSSDAVTNVNLYKTSKWVPTVGIVVPLHEEIQ
jgi:hypothetical protein